MPPHRQQAEAVPRHLAAIANALQCRQNCALGDNSRINFDLPDSIRCVKIFMQRAQAC